MIRNGTKNHYRALVYALNWLFKDFIGPDGRIDWEILTPRKINAILDKVGIDMDASAKPLPIVKIDD